MEFTFSGLPLPVTIRLGAPMSDDELLRFCAEHDLLRIERLRTGELIVMSPSGAGTGASNAELTYQITRWAHEAGGIAFDSNTGFSLPDGSMMSPDAAWMVSARWESLAPADQARFAPICPNFVVELRSPSDRIPDLQAKMIRWIENGAQLAWLLDSASRSVWVYRPGEPAEVHHDPSSVAGTGPALGFELVLDRIWR